MCIEWNDDWLIKDIYEHQNSNSMNEYNGFKVGDKVEITSFFNVRSEGVITSFGDRKVGGFAEPDTLEVWVNKICCFDLLYLIRHDKIKKLPKYSVGDVVRRNNKQLIKCEITSVDQLCDNTYVYTLSDCGSARFSESMLIPFDGFHVGDTVWTVKRGKGKVTGNTMNKSDERQFMVEFENGLRKKGFPKTSNLIPTESLYKEALNKTGYAFKIDVAVVDEYDPKDSVAKHFEKIEKAAQAMNLIHSAAKIWANAFGRTTDQIKFPSGGVVHQCPPRYGFYKDGLPIDPICVIKSWQPPAPNPYFGQVQVAPSAKFKVGDAVYFKNIGHSLCATENPNKYIVISPNAAGGFVTLKRWDNEAAATCRESDLRLWVETKFTHKLVGREIKTLILNFTPNDFVSIKCLPTEYGDMAFYCTTKEGQSIILFGIKGDDWV